MLKKVVINNIRCHEYFEFEPELNGATSICGENGTGKSTIVDSLAWALFGTRLHGLKNSSYIKEGVDPKEKEVSVCVYIYSGNKEYKIKREIKNLNGNSECNVYSREINTEEEFKFESGPTITHAEEFIRKVLGMNEKGFFASTFIQQKQVDQIISSTPRERGEVIEQLLGISSIVEAISMSREHIRDLQKSAGLIQYRPQEEELEKVEALKKEAKELIEELDKDKTALKSKYDDLIASEKDFKSSTERREKIEVLEEKVKSVSGEIKVMQNSLKDKIDLISKMGDKSNNKAINFEVLENKYNEIYNKNIKLSSDLSIKKATLLDLDKLYSINIENTVPQKYRKAVDELSKVEELIKDISVEISILNNKISDNEAFLNKLEQGIKECPFCGEEIKDIDKERSKHIKILNKDKEELNKKDTCYDKAMLNKDFLEKEIEELKELALIKKEQNDKTKEYKSLKEEIENIEKDSLSVSTELKVLTEEYDKAKLVRSNSESLTQLKKEVKEINEDLKTKSKELEKYEKEMDGIGIITASEYRAILKSFNDKKDSYNEDKVKFVEKQGKLNLVKEKGREALASYNRNEELIKNYTELMKKLEILNATNDSLVAFKENRINASIPALTSIASDLYSKFTEGEFIEMKLSSDFKTSVVTKDGIERPVNQLSGGELSTAAIALRLAIAIFLHDNKQSLLILDEVLVSMSENRSQIILESIASMSQTQVIFIAHSNIANSLADKVVSVERN